MTKSNILFIGLDVHKESIEVAFAEDGISGEVRHYGKIGGRLADIDKLLRKLVSKDKTCIFVMKQALAVMNYSATSAIKAIFVLWLRPR